MKTVIVKVGYAFPASPIADKNKWPDGGHYCLLVAEHSKETYTKCRDKSHALEMAAEYMLVAWRQGRMCDIRNY
ncbi:MAG: hypothetical protein J6V72_19825 [Kiritimatiellae bacterium]|nr:hypothetical protein [Kiritimatiellia bacterium]